MQIVRTFGQVMGSTLLVAGTSIGLGILALPIVTAAGGFIPSVILYLICWAFMLGTGLLILEACIWMPKNANLITLSARLLGSWGKKLCWVLYVVLFTTLMVAHTVGGAEVISLFTGKALPFWTNALLYILFFAPIIYLGVQWVDRFNCILFVGLILGFLMLFIPSFPYVNASFLTRMDWGKASLSFPLVFTAFGYQNLIPTLFNYMNRHVAATRMALILGTSIPLLLYILWEFLILGVIPFTSKGGLKEAMHSMQSAVNPLLNYIHHPTLLIVGQIMAFFAMTTSFLGISLAFVDFLFDGLKLPKKKGSRLWICTMIFLVPFILTLMNPSLFICVLSKVGGLLVTLLLGALPILMVWAGRYHEGYSLMHQQLPGGKVLLFCMFAFVGLELIMTFLR